MASQDFIDAEADTRDRKDGRHIIELDITRPFTPDTDLDDDDDYDDMIASKDGNTTKKVHHHQQQQQHPLTLTCYNLVYSIDKRAAFVAKISRAFQRGPNKNKSCVEGTKLAEFKTNLMGNDENDDVKICMEDLNSDGNILSGGLDEHEYSQQTQNQHRKIILHKMSNVFKPGELWAVMGPSGCGKSTLLNVLGNRVYKSDCEGAVYVNDSMVTKELSRRFGYVMQDDVMYENLTVLETLEYAVRLRRGKMRISTKWKERIDKVLDDLGLTHCKHSRIGGFFHRGLSGGEKRRVSIALQLLKNEQTVLLLDEPSSGLDSSTAHQMLKTLRNVATKRNQIVVCTIHQPHSKMYKLFDKVLLLSHGHVLYAGDADKAVDYFSILGYPVQDHTNPSDHMLELASGVVFSKEKSTADISFSDETCDSKIEQLAQEYSNSTLCAMNEQEALSHIPKHAAQKKRKRLSTPIRYFLKEWSRLFILISRNIKEEMHSPINLLFRVSCAVFVALLLGLLYYNLQPNVESILDRQGALFFLPVNLSIFPVFLVLNTFIKEKRIYSREHEQGLYASFTYYLNKVIGELPFLLPLPIIFSLIAYPMMNLQHDVQHWFVGTLTLVFLTLCAQSLGLLISTYSPNINIANIISPIVFSVLLLFTGLFVNISNIPVYFRWISYINYAKYGFESIAFNDLYNLPLKCAEESCPVSSGNDILAQLSMTDVSIGMNIFYMLLLCGGMHVMAYIGLVFMNNNAAAV